MSKTWDELANDAFRLAEDLYNDMVARGIEIDPKTRSKYDELSKLHQPAVIKNEVAVCDKCLGRGSIIIYDTCLDCEKCKGSGTQTFL